MANISVVINTLNEEKNLPRVLTSVRSLASEIVVVDMNSDDSTAKIAKESGARIYEYRRMGYVEPARNFAISKSSGDWILILDADEVVSPTLAVKLKEIVEKPTASYFRIPRKNINFGKWMKHSLWWPDYNIRFFKRGTVAWNNEIHSIPLTTGVGADLPADEKFAIVHYNYASVEQYLERLNRYTSVQAEELIKKNHKFIWKDLIKKPLSEFLSRYFFGEGYKDGLHGLALSLLQSFSELIVYIKIWQNEKFLEQTTTIEEVDQEMTQSMKEIKWWIRESKIKHSDLLTSAFLRIVHKLSPPK